MAQNDEKWPRFFLLAVFLHFHLTLERNLPGFKFFLRDLFMVICESCTCIGGSWLMALCQRYLPLSDDVVRWRTSKMLPT